MSSMLELVLAERAAQAEEEGRPPFASVDDLRRFIIDQTPPPYVNVALEMCVLSVQEQDLYWKLELIDKSSRSDFRELAAAFEHLDSHRRNRFVFQLTLWKNRNRLANNVQFREGFAYHFNKVHALAMRYSCPCGSIQLREGFTAKRLSDLDATSIQDAGAQLSGTTSIERTSPSGAPAIGVMEQGSEVRSPLADHGVKTSTASLPGHNIDATLEASESVSEQHQSPKRKARDLEAREAHLVSPQKRPKTRPQKNAAL